MHMRTSKSYLEKLTQFRVKSPDLWSNFHKYYGPRMLRKSIHPGHKIYEGAGEMRAAGGTPRRGAYPTNRVG